MKYDYVIVGAGFVGLSTAFWLREHSSSAKILVVDKSGIGEGASGKNAGFLTKGSAFFYRHLVERWGEVKALEIFKFAESSLKLLDEHILSSSGLEYLETSSLTLFRENAPELPDGFGFELSPSPFSSVFSGALRSPYEFKIRSLNLLLHMHELLKEKNVDFRLNSLPPLEVGSQKTIYCLNAYTSTLLPEFKDRIQPKRAQMLRVRMSPSSVPGEELFYDPSERVYFRKEGQDKLLIGGKRLVDPRNEETLTEGNSDLIQSALETYLKSLDIKFEVMDRWSGIMGFTENELPILEDQNNRIVLGGFSGHGMGLGFHAGKVAAERVLGIKKGPLSGPFSLTF